MASATVGTRVNPIGVDPAQARFGWKLTSSTSQQRQSAYQIVVSANGSDVWDSGQVASGQQADVAYGGPAFGSLTAYTWRVRVWDAQGRASGWSPVQRFETALRAPATEWTGAFIGRSAAGPDLMRRELGLVPGGRPGRRDPMRRPGTSARPCS